MKTSIQSRLLLFLLVSYIPVLLIILLNNQTQRQQAQQEAQASALQQAREIAFFHGQQIRELEDILKLLSQTHFIKTWDMELCMEVVTDMLTQFPNWANIAVMDESATVQCSGVPDRLGVNYADRDFVQEAFATGQATNSGFVVGRVTGEPTFGVALPIYEADGTSRGLITIGVIPDLQSEFIAAQVLSGNHRMTILDQNNIVTFRYPTTELGIGTQYNESLLQHIEGKTEGTFEAIGLEGDQRLYGFTRFEPAAAIVLVSIEKTRAFAQVNLIQQRNLLVMVVIFTITTLLIILASRLIARPLRQLSEVTQQFARGDLSKRINMESGITEIMRIQRAFNDMAASIEARIEERTATLQQVNTQLAAEIQIRKEIESELERFTARLRESNRDLEQFAYVASHDMREPLRKIIAFSERLQKSNLPEEQRQDYLNRVNDAATRMTLMIDNLLLYARIDQQHNTQTEVSLTAVAQQVVSDLDPLIKETQGSVRIDALPTIQADLVQMQRLFQNLIANALKYYRDGVPPVVHLTTQEIDQTIQIRVEDNGVGIPEKDSERIFMIFERLHGRNQGGGAGLGLAICRKIMQHHGGEITLESVVGTGTIFILHFPIVLKFKPESSETT
jgi:signal transduction histidine kinase